MTKKHQHVISNATTRGRAERSWRRKANAKTDRLVNSIGDGGVGYKKSAKFLRGFNPKGLSENKKKERAEDVQADFTRRNKATAAAPMAASLDEDIIDIVRTLPATIEDGDE